jgi:predicted DNA-binding transcriptional regulator AlpA
MCEKVMLGVKDVMKLMGIGRDRAYELMNSKQFHVIKVGRRLIVHKDVFTNWLKGQS